MKSNISAGCKRLLAHSLEKIFLPITEMCVITKDEADIKVLNNALTNIGLPNCHQIFAKTHSAILSDKISTNLYRIYDLFKLDDDYLFDLLSNTKNARSSSELHPCNPSFSITQSLLCTLAFLHSKNELTLLRSLSISDRTLSLLFGLSIHDINRIASHADFHHRKLITFHPTFMSVVLKKAHKDSCDKDLLFNVVKRGITQNDCEKYFNVKKTQVSLIRKNIGASALSVRTLKGVPCDALKSIRNVYERDYGLYIEETERIYNVACMQNLNFSQVANAINQYNEFYNYIEKHGCSFEFASLFFSMPHRICKNYPKTNEAIHINKELKDKSYAIFLELKNAINPMETDKENAIRLKGIVGNSCSELSIRIDTLFNLISLKLAEEEQVKLRLIFKKLAVIYQ
ncbi:hypothetical protein [Aliivibrio fischeri]|uniref:hypothetical protein n=1 Tax=Aliivibrio fischeri TaxID=668 RepID=UPI0007C4C984|nr:hypothetical protein [Aliivibrio fischeri]